MTKTRWIAVAAAAAVLAVSGVAYGVTAGGEDTAGPAAPSTTTSTTERPTTTTTEATTTTTAPTTTTVDPALDGVLRKGDKGPEVEALQRRLLELHFDPGPADGSYGQAVAYAVMGFQKLNGMRPDGVVGPEVQAALANPATYQPLVPDGGPGRTEVDMRRQLLVKYVDGQVRLISHVSTGSGESYCVEGDCDNKAITPQGAFRYAWRYDGWRQSRLGKLYNPVYFTNRGHAVHGSLSVPTYPASHGCVRIPMHIAEYFPSLVKRGDAIYVTDGRPVGPPKAPTGPPPADPPTTPGGDGTTTTTTAPPPTTSTTQPTTTTSTTSTTLPLP